MKHLIIIVSILFSLNSSVFSQADVKAMVDLANDLVKLNRYDEAMEKFNEALDYLPSYAPGINGKANLLILQGEYKDAYKLVDDGIQKNSDFAPYYLTRGIILINNKRYDKAIEDLNRALDLTQGKNDKILENKIYVNRGAAYQKLTEYDAALSDYSKAISLSTKNPNVYMYRGFLYYQTQDYNEALKDFNLVIEIDPENPIAYYNRGMIYLKLDNETDACRDFHKSCELGNTNACKMVVSRCVNLTN